MRRYTYRILLVALFIGIVVLLRVAGVGKYITVEQLKFQREYLQLLVHEHYLFVVLAYIATYILTVALLIPIAAVLTIASGLLFGTFWGAVYTNIGATIGAILAFLLVRYSLGNLIQERYQEQLIRFNRAMEREGTSYLLVVHFIAVIPFAVINILAGLTRVSLWTFIWTTSVGIFPGSLVYAYAGSQLNTIESVRDIFSWNILLAFILLALLASLPVLIKRIRRT